MSDSKRQDVSSVADDGVSLIHNLNANIDKGTGLCCLHATFLVRQLFADTNQNVSDLQGIGLYIKVVNTRT
jgi:hypothetical protein